MATEKTFTLNLDDGNAKTYASTSTLTLGTNDMYARLYLNGGSTGYATLNDAAKAVLYPTATAKPFKVDSEMRISRNVGGTAEFQLQFAGTSVHTKSTSSSSYNTYSASSTASVVKNSNRSTQIRHYLHVSSTLYGARLLWANITLHFYQYSCSAQKGNVNDGINSVSCSNAAPYTGDSVTWSVDLKNGAQWFGWYSDAACTNLVSSDKSYTSTPNQDKTLYAKATMPIIIATNLYVKQNGAYKQVIKLYKKTNNSWNIIDTDSLDTTANYVYGGAV